MGKDVKNSSSYDQEREDNKKANVLIGILAAAFVAAAAAYHVVSENWDSIKKAHEANAKSIDEKGAWGSFREVYLGEDVPSRTSSREELLERKKQSLRSIESSLRGLSDRSMSSDTESNRAIRRLLEKRRDSLQKEIDAWESQNEGN